jgi:alkanesulfonate monooxygenase SsuD/methylene tetrahydromethanopterin reductase-like flavin-dependent oxidoreductase (luciferase family)
MFTMRFDMRAPQPGASITDLYGTAIEMAQWAEQNGGMAIVLSEHHSSPDGYLPSPMILAAAIAARTSTIPISISALLLNFADPIRVAEDMAVLDIVSGGRVSYIIGLGYRAEEYAMFGVDLAQRGAVMERKLGALRRALRGEQFEYEGRTVHVTPSPVTPGGPFIAYGGHSLAAARRAGRHGLSFFGEGPNDALEAVYREACEEAGHPPMLVHLPAAGMVTSAFVAKDPDEAWSRYGPHMLHDARMYGAWMGDSTHSVTKSNATTVEELRAENASYRIFTPDEAVDYARTWTALGLQPLCGGMPPALAWESLQTIESDVLPRLRDA